MLGSLVLKLCYGSYVILVSQIMILSMLTMHSLSAHCLRRPCKSLDIEDYDIWIIFLLDDLYEKVFYVCFVYIPLLWYLFDLYMKLDILYCFLCGLDVLWLMSRGYWLWACLLQQIRLYTKNILCSTIWSQEIWHWCHCFWHRAVHWLFELAFIFSY